MWLKNNQLESSKKKKNRQKRQADQYEYTPTKTRCPLLLVADYRFFQEMGGGNTKTTINYLVNFKNKLKRVVIVVTWRFCFFSDKFNRSCT